LYRNFPFVGSSGPVSGVSTHRNFLHSAEVSTHLIARKNFRFYGYAYSPPPRHHQDLSVLIDMIDDHQRLKLCFKQFIQSALVRS
jgi:hypothetical protein